MTKFFTNDIPRLNQQQIAKFNLQSLRAKKFSLFDPKKTFKKIKTLADQKVLAIDIGGYKIEVKNTLTKNLQADQGAGYLKLLETVAFEATNRQLPVGISFAGVVEGKRPLIGPNLSVLMKELQQKYFGDFQKLFPTLKFLANDAVAGLIAGSSQIQKTYSQAKNIIFIINGSDIGGSILKKGEIWALEPGHLEIVLQLNPNHQDEPCGFEGSQFVCVSSVAASREGIEDLWLKKTAQKLDGRQISEHLQQGDKLAAKLYHQSALVTAHVILGMGKVFKLLDDPAFLVIICHGGTFKVPGYSELVQQILEKYLGQKLQIVLTYDFSENACLDGAAIGAMVY